MTPIRDAALCIELGERVVRELMTRDDWTEMIERYLEKAP